MIAKKTLLLILASMFSLAGCENSQNTKNLSDNTSQGEDIGNLPIESSVCLGETFRFDDLDITFKEDIFFTTINEHSSVYFGCPVFGIPITLKNNKTTKHHLDKSLCQQFGGSGKGLPEIDTSLDNDVYFASDLLPNEEYTQTMYFLFDIDGMYTLIFENGKQKVTLEFNVNFIGQLDVVFEYDHLNLIFSSKYEIIKYQSSEYSPIRYVVKMPVKVINIGSRPNFLGNLEVNVFGPQGEKISDMCPYYMYDDAVEFADNLEPGESYTKSMYFEYVGDGDYRIEFGAYSVEKVLKFNISTTN